MLCSFNSIQHLFNIDDRNKQSRLTYAGKVDEVALIQITLLLQELRKEKMLKRYQSLAV